MQLAELTHDTPLIWEFGPAALVSVGTHDAPFHTWAVATGPALYPTAMHQVAEVQETSDR